MATNEQAPATPDGAAPAAANKKSVMMMAIAGVVVGAGAGLFGVGPLLAKNKTAAPAPKVAEAPAAGVNHAVGNLVLNPAGSNGQRFLMVTATFELKDATAEEKMKEKDAEIRDHILNVLGRKTVEELSDISQRDGIKKEVLEAVAALLPKGSLRKLYFEQFVIQ